jgi:hypothetical protein
LESSTLDLIIYPDEEAQKHAAFYFIAHQGFAFNYDVTLT